MNPVPDILHTTCAYCGVGCGINATLKDPAARLVHIEGDNHHPANAGRLCSKGTALGETLDTHGRLLHPRLHGKEVFWNEALDAVAKKTAQVHRESGPDAIAFYVSGQLLTEDYYVANKLAKGFIGTPHIDTNSRLCMASTVVAQQRAFGEDVVPGCYEDLELADLVILVGSNAAWCHPVLFQRLATAREQHGTRIVVIDPRRTTTCSIADMHLPVRAGTDAALFNGLLVWLANNGALDQHYITEHTRDFDATLTAARNDAGTLSQLAEHCGVVEEDLRTVFEWFARTPRTVTCWSQGVNQSSGGTDKVNAIINCHLATGRIGKPGASPFSLTGQPNAMGGREVGGLSTQLAAHRLPEDPEAHECISQFWETSSLPKQRGLKAIDLFDAVEKNRIRFLWIIGTNPAVSMPDAERVRQAIAGCEFVVVSDCMNDNDTLRHAHVALPAQAWGEKNGTVTNSERCISRQRTLVASTGEARPDWWALAQIAKRLGYIRGFNWQHPGEIFREHAALSALANPAGSGRQFNLGALATITQQAYDALAPFQWPWRNGENPVARVFADGHFAHPDGLARFVPVDTHTPKNANSIEFPLILNTGRLRDQWHTMTRTGEVARLNRHDDAPFVAVHPSDAARFSVAHNALARVQTAQGSAILRVQITDAQLPGSLFAPMHWTRKLTAGGIVGALTNACVDPHSGQPELKHTPARLAPVSTAATAVIFSTRLPAVPDADFAVLTRIRHGWKLEVASINLPAILSTWLQALCPTFPEGIWQHSETPHATSRLCEQQGLLQLVAVASTSSDNPETQAGINSAEQLFNARQSNTDMRAQLLSLKDEEKPSPVVCACLEVNAATLRDAGRCCSSVKELSETTRAGTRCGSCLPEMAIFIAQ
jgi:assimilatory nitrate reductase catalytic subunit